MNQIEMDSDDKEKRWKEANTPKWVSMRIGCLVAGSCSCFFMQMDRAFLRSVLTWST